VEIMGCIEGSIDHMGMPDNRDMVALHRTRPTTALTMAHRKRIHHITISAADGAIMGEWIRIALLFSLLIKLQTDAQLLPSLSTE
jgi:hypothetical protein